MGTPKAFLSQFCSMLFCKELRYHHRPPLFGSLGCLRSNHGWFSVPLVPRLLRCRRSFLFRLLVPCFVKFQRGSLRQQEQSPLPRERIMAALAPFVHPLSLQCSVSTFNLQLFLSRHRKRLFSRFCRQKVFSARLRHFL